jgi:hypothetical protein
MTPTVWVVDDTGFAKDGPASACVARQCSGTLGKVGNCQIAVNVHAATDAASAVLDWRLFVPEPRDMTCVTDEAGNVANGHPDDRRQAGMEADNAVAHATAAARRITDASAGRIRRGRGRQHGLARRNARLHP